jgi:hypothetical protein
MLLEGIKVKALTLILKMLELRFYVPKLCSQKPWRGIKAKVMPKLMTLTKALRCEGVTHLRDVLNT